MAVRRSIRARKPVRKAIWRRAKKAAQVAWWTRTPVIAGIVVAIFAAAVLLGVYQDHRAAQRTAVSRSARMEAPVSTSASMDRATTDTAPAQEAPAATTVAQVADTPAAVTITGCLERSDDAFRLTDTVGAGAPTSRSWKSAFLKKRSKAIGVIPAKRLNLASHVGERISVTGTLVDREMRVASVQRVAVSCQEPAKTKA